jgi:thiopurine S-methyltransferase
MDHEFWRARWNEGRIAFHEGKANAFLTRHGDWLAQCHRILVPLCGKTEDLAYLASRGHEVLGVELVEDAVRQFFAEHAATPEISEHDELRIYRAGVITIIAGDFFATTRELVGTIDGIYDRAAIVALPPDVRSRYVAHLRAITPTAKRELLVSIDYPPGFAEGPPFSVDSDEVRSWFPSAQLVDEGNDQRGRAERCYTIALAR